MNPAYIGQNQASELYAIKSGVIFSKPLLLFKKHGALQDVIFSSFPLLSIDQNIKKLETSSLAGIWNWCNSVWKETRYAYDTALMCLCSSISHVE